MNPRDDGQQNSPTRSKGQAPADTSSSVHSELETYGVYPIELSSGVFEDASASLSMADIGLLGNPPSSWFDSPFMDFKAFPTMRPTSLSSPSPLHVASDERAPSVPTSIKEETGLIETSGELEGVHVPQPLECLQGNLVPPFLWKTYDLVDDLSLDPIISWGSTGASFVVWDPVEFARIILPRNFKHSNFSSFIRQLNTYGFRKIDTDKWEFANEGFKQGKRHLLKNIQRRRSMQSQHAGSYLGPSSEAGKSGVEVEIEGLRKERSMLIQDVVDLQQQHRRTVHQAGQVNQRLQSAEQRQKQMVSFLAKLFQSPAFLARLQQKKEQTSIDSPRVRRKFVEQHQHETGTSDSSKEGQIVKCQPDWRDITNPSETPVLNPISIEQSPDYLSRGWARELSSVVENPYVQADNVVSDELAAASEMITTPEIIAEGSSSLGLVDPLSKGKNVMSPSQEDIPEDLTREKSFSMFYPPETESIIKQDVWNPGFNVCGATSGSANEMWGNPMNYEVPEFGVTGGMSDLWDISYMQETGNLGIDKWTTDEFPPNETPGQADRPEDDRSKNVDP